MARSSTTKTKGCAPTKGTRHGNGKGLYGPAKGKGNHGPGPGRPTREVAAVIALAKAERLDALKDHLVGLALTAERESDQITATLGYLKHEDDKAAPQRSEVVVTTNVNRTLD